MFTATRRVAGFTLVELLVSISILATISIVGYVSAHSYMMKANNSERMASMDALKSGLNNYYQVKKTLPEPNSNHIYYDERGTYVHSASGSFGVSGHASRDFYPAEYANTNAFDPETKQFFGYGKLSDNSAFDIATALYVDTGIYKTYLDGTYDGGQLPSLVRSYHSSDFVVQDSTELLPYDPFELKVTAKLVTWSGTLAPVIWIGSMNETTCISSPTASLTGELMTGDCIGVGTGSTALLHISDGSELSLGSTGGVTILELKDLRYKENDNLVTKVLLHLSAGEVWSEAPRLREINENESEMQIYTTTALAAVRGTVFGVSIDPTSKNTTLSLASGQIDVGKNPVITDGLPFIGDTDITTTSFNTTDGFSTTATGGFVFSGGITSMVVPDGGKPISLTVPPTVSDSENTTPASTGTIDSAELQKKLHFIPFGLGYRPVVTDASFTGTAVGSTAGILSVKFENPGATAYQLAFVTDTYDMSQPLPDSIPFLTGSLDSTSPTSTITREFPITYNKHRTIILRLCYENLCSAPYIQGVQSDTFSYNDMNRQIPRRLNCPDGQQQFDRFGCQPKELVAFAPYDRPSDILMYTSRGGSLGFSTNRIIGSGSYASNDNARYALEAIRGFTTNKNTCIPQLSTTTMAFASATCMNTSTNLNDLASKGFRFDVPNSFFDIPQVGSPAVRGVLLENSGSTDYMKYDLTQLNLGDKFAIEMSVRGAALKRPETSSYFFFHSSNDYKLKKMGNYLQFKIGSLDQAYPLPISELTDNIFYTIRFTQTGTSVRLQILGTSYDHTGTLPSGSTPGNFVTIGAYDSSITTPSTPYKSQWNDIIDGVKIYRLR